MEGINREMRRVRQQLEEERQRRKAAEEVRDKLVAESKPLHSERQQLQDLRSSHTSLQGKHENAEIELTAQKQRMANLQIEMDRLKSETDHAVEANQRTIVEKAELQTRLRQAQERCERA